MYWASTDLVLYSKRIWKRVAYATRYGMISLSEALAMDLGSMRSFNEALDEIVHEENKRSR